MESASGLRSLLRLRRSLERASRFALRQVLGEIRRVEHELEQIRAERGDLRRAMQASLRDGASGGELALFEESTLERTEKQTIQNLRLLQARLVEAEAHYAECRRDRQVIENMLRRREAEWQQEALRREQAQMDEATLRRMGSAAANIGRIE